MAPYNEKLNFRLFVMPCCSHQLCWVNPRLPTYCPECGKLIYSQLRSGEHTTINSPAWLRVEDGTPKPIEARRGEGK